MTAALLHFAAIALLAAPPAVAVRPLEGEALHGQLTELSATSVKLQTTAGVKEAPTGQIMWLELTPRPVAEKPTVWLELLDGSKLAASAYTAESGKSHVTLVTGQQVELPTRSIHTVRFYPQTPELAVQWREISSSMASGDTLVIRKISTRTLEQGDAEPRVVTEHALDQVEGAIREVTPDTVVFELDGQRVDVRREKLEGIVYYQSSRKEFPAPLCRLTDAAGTQWLLKTVELNGDALAATTLGGLSFQLPLANAAKLDFSLANVAFLSDLEAEPAAVAATSSLQPAAMSHKFSRIFKPRSAPPLGTDSFRMGGQRFDNGLALHSPAKLLYRVPAGFRKFHAVAGIDDSILAPGRFTLLVQADGKEVLRHEFSDEQRKPLTLALDVANVRRITIELAPGDGQDIGDQLNLCDARFTR